MFLSSIELSQHGGVCFSSHGQLHGCWDQVDTGLDFIGVILSNKYNEVKKRQESWGISKGYIKITDPGM